MSKKYQHNGTEFIEQVELTASVIPYDPTASGLAATKIKDALDELAELNNPEHFDSIPATLLAGKSYKGTLSGNKSVALGGERAGKVNEWRVLIRSSSAAYTFTISGGLTIKWSSAFPSGAFSTTKTYELNITKYGTTYYATWVAFDD